MSTKVILRGALTVLLLSTAGLKAQTPFSPMALPPIPESPRLPDAPPTPAEALPIGAPVPPPVAPNPLADAGYAPVVADGLTPAHWLPTPGCGCCGPVGGHGPIGDELYLRNGPTIPVSGGFLGDRLQVAWMVEGGGRTLFFNPEQDAAWTIDLGLGIIRNNGRAEQFPLLADGGNLITARGMQRQYVAFGLGREWFALRPSETANSGISNLRLGADLGGRLGTAHLDANLFGAERRFDYLRYHDVFGAYYMALHGNVEIPVGGWYAFIGLRAEWTASWLEFVDGDRNDLHEINFLLNLGVRF